MGPDDDADDDALGLGPPLPPDDRLWRHPSELGALGVVGGQAPAGGSAVASTPSARPAPWPVALVAGLAGAVLATGAIALTGSLSPEVVERPVVEKVAVTPVVSSPMVRGERGVVAVAERLGPAIVRIDVVREGGTDSGSGVLYRDDGLVLTSAAVVAGTTTIDVLLTDGRHFDGHLLGSDELTGIALVDLDAEGLPVAVLGTAEGLEVGAPTIAIGSPLGPDSGPSVTTGVISAVGRRAQTVEGGTLHGMIQTDAPVTAGSSGGALVDASGAVIGIAIAVADDGGGRFGFATPIDLARRVADHLLADGAMTHGWLGIEGADLASADAADLGVSGGATVRAVAAASPAAHAGLAAGDVITEVDGTPVLSISALVVALREHDPGDEVAVGYWRDGTHRETTCTLAAHP